MAGRRGGGPAGRAPEDRVVVVGPRHGHGRGGRRGGGGGREHGRGQPVRGRGGAGQALVGGGGAQASKDIDAVRNAVKGAGDAYEGSGGLCAWDGAGPVLRTWSNTFPGLVKPKAEISPELLSHLRYPEDLFKVQRDVLAKRISGGEEKSVPAHVERVAEAQRRLAAEADEELARLVALQAVNPSVRDSEIDALRKQREDGLAMLEKAALRLEAIRVLVAG